MARTLNQWMYVQGCSLYYLYVGWTHIHRTHKPTEVTRRYRGSVTNITFSKTETVTQFPQQNTVKISKTESRIGLPLNSNFSELTLTIHLHCIFNKNRKCLSRFQYKVSTFKGYIKPTYYIMMMDPPQVYRRSEILQHNNNQPLADLAIHKNTVHHDLYKGFCSNFAALVIILTPQLLNSAF